MNVKATLTILFGVSIAIANVTAAKLAWFEVPLLDGVAVPAGFVAFGVAFLCSDLLVEFEGREYAHDVVNGTVVALVAAYGLIYVAIELPTAPFYADAQAFETILGSGARVTVASVVALMISQHVDVRAFAGLRERTGGRHKWIRNTGSTALSQGLDTVVFITIAFAGTVAPTELALIVVGQYSVKLVVALLDTPLFYVVTAAREHGLIEKETTP